MYPVCGIEGNQSPLDLFPAFSFPPPRFELLQPFLDRLLGDLLQVHIDRGVDLQAAVCTASRFRTSAPRIGGPARQRKGRRDSPWAARPELDLLGLGPLRLLPGDHLPLHHAAEDIELALAGLLGILQRGQIVGRGRKARQEGAFGEGQVLDPFPEIGSWPRQPPRRRLPRGRSGSGKDRESHSWSGNARCAGPGSLPLLSGGSSAPG